MPEEEIDQFALANGPQTMRAKARSSNVITFVSVALADTFFRKHVTEFCILEVRSAWRQRSDERNCNVWFRGVAHTLSVDRSLAAVIWTG